VILGERYDIPCPCGETTSLRERTLRQIVDNLTELDRAAPEITFVCLQCDTPFRFDHQNREPSEPIDESLRSSEPFVCIVTTKCGELHCGCPVELVAVSKSGVTDKQLHAELRKRDWTKFPCRKHRDSSSFLGSMRQI